MTVRLELRRDAGRFGPANGPWVMRKQIAKIQGPPDPLALAEVVNHRGEVLARALFSPESEIVGRVISWGDASVPANWLQARIRSAMLARRELGLQPKTTGYRLINSEGDFLPGLVVDRYGNHVVIAATTLPMVARQEEIVRDVLDALKDSIENASDIDCVVVCPESAGQREGFAAAVHWQGPAQSHLHFRENGLELSVAAPPSQQKTGGYHDQRDNRQHVADLLVQSNGKLLELGCHVAGFALHAAARGVKSVGVDQSTSVLQQAQANATQNQIQGMQWVAADLFAPWKDPLLQESYACIVIDPPKMCASRRDRDQAVVALSKVVAKALRILDERGWIVLCSCSQPLGISALDEAVHLATISNTRSDANQMLTRCATYGPGLDHPVAPGHEAGEYLRVAVYQRRQS
jgi:23S rRNA (cytosine1962-C5)-methyltransferase